MKIFLKIILPAVLVLVAGLDLVFGESKNPILPAALGNYLTQELDVVLLIVAALLFFFM